MVIDDVKIFNLKKNNFLWNICFYEFIFLIMWINKFEVNEDFKYRNEIECFCNCGGR